MVGPGEVDEELEPEVKEECEAKYGEVVSVILYIFFIIIIISDRFLFLGGSSLVVRASDCQCRSRNSPGFDPSILRHSEIWGAADEAMLNTVHKIGFFLAV
jgi:hypothetical protein